MAASVMGAVAEQGVDRQQPLEIGTDVELLGDAHAAVELHGLFGDEARALSDLGLGAGRCTGAPGMLAYFAVIVAGTHAIAFCSWHLIEKPAMSLKDWSPAWLRNRSRSALAGGPETQQPDTSPELAPAYAGTATDA